MDEQNVAARLKSFLDYLHVSNSQFADNCGIPRPSLSQLLSGRNKKLSDVVVGQIHRAYPELSVLWLMFGEGEMTVPPPLDPAFAGEAEKFIDEDPLPPENENLSGLTTPRAAPKPYAKQSVTPEFPIANPLPQKAEKPPKPRKVLSITVFYDDNSYETFFPEKK